MAPARLTLTVLDSAVILTPLPSAASTFLRFTITPIVDLLLHITFSSYTLDVVRLGTGRDCTMNHDGCTDLAWRQSPQLNRILQLAGMWTVNILHCSCSQCLRLLGRLQSSPHLSLLRGSKGYTRSCRPRSRVSTIDCDGIAPTKASISSAIAAAAAALPAQR